MSRRETRPRPRVEPLLVNASEVASMLSISKTTLWRLRASGRLPKPVRIGGSIRWRTTEIRFRIGEGGSNPGGIIRHSSWPNLETTTS